MFQVLKLFGFSIFSIENGKSVTKPKDILFLIGNLSLSYILLSYALMFRSKLLTTKSEILNFGNFVTFIAAMCVVSISMIITFVFRHRTWKIIVRLSKIDRMLNNIGFDEDYSVMGRILVSIFVFLMMLSIPLNCYTCYAEGSPLKAGLYFYSSFYYLLTSALILIFMSGTFFRMRTVRKVCESMMQYPSSILIVTSEELNNDNELISILFDVYRNLVKIQHEINFCCGGISMMGLGLLMFYSIFTVFMTFKDLSDDGKLEQTTISSVLFASYLNLFLSAVVQICTLNENEAQKTLRLSNQILSRSNNTTKTALLMSLNSLITRNPPKLSCGLFEFDLNLVYGVSCTTFSN